jgi:nitronate monooxygenase
LYIREPYLAPRDFTLDVNDSSIMSPFTSRLMTSLKLKYPLIVAPMAGGPTTVELVVASSDSGALGSVGAAYLSPSVIHEWSEKICAQTDKPFAFNLFVPSKIPAVSEVALTNAIDQTKEFREELGIPRPQLVPPYEDDFDFQFEAVLAVKPAVFSFVFGLLPQHFISEAQKRGIFVIGTATTPEEAFEIQESGVDAVVLQGLEAGGHRGIFNADAHDPNIPALELLRQTKQKVAIPLILAGGLMTTADIESALQAGADSVQLGSAFLATSEAGTSEPYRRMLLETEFRKTKLTRAFSGRLARGIENRFMTEMDSKAEAILPFPAQNKFTRDLRNTSLAKGSADFLSLWCGSGSGPLWTGSTKELIESLFAPSSSTMVF